MTVRVQAFGKVFLAGEYAVLEAGSPALVAGVDRTLTAVAERTAGGLQLVSPQGSLWDGGTAPPELRFAARAASLAAMFCRPRAGVRVVFENDFAVDGRKLGLGGSAAASVLAVRAVCAAAERAVSEEEVVALAVAAHWVEQGGSGSGADVAAAALGGVLEARSRIPWRSPEEARAMPVEALAAARPVEVRRLQIPPRLRLLLVDTGAPADSRAFVREVQAFAAGDPRRWAKRAADIRAVAEELRDALESGDEAAALDSVRRGAAAMAALGEDAHLRIVTPELARACALAASAGAAGKPSGAGGGDCAVVIAFGDDGRDRAEGALRPHFPVLRVSPA